MLKIKFHSVVDVITNSSTVIFTYQNSTKEAKELINEVLKLQGETKTADDVFYFGVFCDSAIYLESEDIPEDCPTDDDYKISSKLQSDWLDYIKLRIMRGEIVQPEWMTNCEDNDSWGPDTYLYIIPKDEKYNDLADKIHRLLGSVTAHAGRDD